MENNKDKKLNSFLVGADCISTLEKKNYKFAEINQEEFEEITTVKNKGITAVTGYPRNTIVYFKQSDKTTIYVLRYAVLYTAISRLPEFQKEYFLVKDLDKLRNAPLVKLRVDFEISKTNYKKILDMQYDKICYPAQAQRYLIDELKSKLSDKEIKDRIKKYQEPEAKPSHKNFLHKAIEFNHIYEISNVHYYDVNKAYASRLAKAFPEIKEDLLNIIAMGKANKYYKKYSKDLFNFAIGCLREKENKHRLYYKAFPSITPKEFNDFRNWIVKDIDKQVKELEYRISGRDGKTFYLNTDGIIIENPEILPEDDQSLGGFKKEIIDNNKIWYYAYEDEKDEWNRYSIMQWFENGAKIIKVIGGFIQDQRLVDLTDLSKGKTVKFKVEERNGRKYITEIKEN